MMLRPIVAVIAALAPAAAGAGPHPFLLWTRQEAAGIRKRIDSDGLARRQYERMRDTDISKGNACLWNLFNYMVMGDAQAGETEKKALLGFIGVRPEGQIPQGTKLTWNRGMPSAGDRHMRDERTLFALRYDVLYDQLSPAERQGVEESFRAYIEFHLSGHKPWHPDFRYDRTSWLPNMHWPRAIGTHVMALALGDEKLIEAMFSAVGGFKWFFDEYIADGRFYMEEFGKYYSNIGSMLLWCEGLEHLGLGKFGYGYTGRGGPSTGSGQATMAGFLRMPIELGYPRTDIPGGMANYRRVTMGDTRGGSGPFEQDIVGGYTIDGKGGNRWWSSAHMNGPMPKMQEPQWFEIGHHRWPDVGFDYFLAQMRKPGEDVYLPTLYFGLGPIDPKKVKPPAVRSYVAPERGFALLRAEEGPGYWESPAPAVALQFGMYYVHYVHDCFSILGYQAFHRPIYINKGNAGKGYAGGDPWRDHVRGHTGVFVDGQRAQPVDNGNHGIANERLRHAFHPPAKFVAIRAKGIYQDIDQERALVLTREYLLDVFGLTGVDGSAGRERMFDWRVQTLGSPQLADEAAWKPVADTGPKSATDPETIIVTGARSFRAGQRPWTFTALQTCLLADVSRSVVGKAWYDRGVGVRVSMLGAEDTTLYTGRPPVPKESEFGGLTLAARRKAPGTTFVALHEPFEGGVGKHRAATFERIAQTPQAVGVRIAGGGIDDRVLLRLFDDCDKPVTLTGGGESFTFADHAFVRITADEVQAYGDLRALKLRAAGQPKLLLNSHPTPATIAGGFLTWAK